MKQILADLLRKHYDKIADDWTSKLETLLSDRLSDAKILGFVKSSLDVFIAAVENSDFGVLDKYLDQTFALFSSVNVNLLEISQLYSQGRYSILNLVEKSGSGQNDPIIFLGYIDEVIERIFASYSMLYHKSYTRELEADRDKLATKLELNQLYLKNILHSSDSAIMIVDKNEKFIAWNQGAEKIFGYTESEVIGQPSSLLLPNEKKYFDELKRIQEEVIRNGQIRIFETERETKYGELLSVRLSVSKLPSDNGEYFGRSIIIKDFTEVKKLQAQVDQSEKLAVIGQLAAGVAHEIGNPLASISSIVQILQRKCKDGFQHEQLSEIKDNIDRITKIVRELVDFSRPPSYETALHDITDIIRTAIGIVRYDKRVHNIKFEVHLQQQLPYVEVAADQLLQVFINIMINALDAVKGNGTLGIKSFSNERSVIVEFSDDGCGMEEDIMDKIFDPFFTTKEVGRGTGLGLSVSYGIIRRFNGEIKVKSAPNLGSTFTIILPINGIK